MQTSEFIPLIQWDENKLLVVRGYVFYFYYKDSEEFEFLINMPIGFLGKFKYSSSYTKRFFRLVNFNSIRINEAECLVFYKSKIYLLSIKDKVCLVELFQIDKGSRPLALFKTTGSAYCKSGVYYGDYSANKDKAHTSIYRITDDLKKEVVYSFDIGEVNHIHALIEDSNNQCIWIFTGDFDEASAIWMAKNNFTNVESVVRGKQKFRSCVGMPFDGMLYYLTDSPYEANTLRCLQRDRDRWVSKLIKDDIEGSVIYGVTVNNKLYYSSCVESNGIYKNKLDMVLTTKIGGGIKSEKVVCYEFDPSTLRNKVIYTQVKDSLPFVLFQFGTFMFPKIDKPVAWLPIFSVATKKNNLKTEFIQI